MVGRMGMQGRGERRGREEDGEEAGRSEDVRKREGENMARLNERLSKSVMEEAKWLVCSKHGLQWARGGQWQVVDTWKES
eukprot:754045-Hanusia_phi.AAC.9